MLKQNRSFDMRIGKRYCKISNLINELHWKSIKYLNDNYKNILVGNLSTTGVVKNNCHLNSTTKRLAHLMRLFVFHKRLKYKCYINRSNYRKVDEMYTSKTCTFCGYIKKDLVCDKVYNRDKCGKSIGRDINGARNIYMVDIVK